MTARKDYWQECIAIAAEECDLTLTPEQLDCLASSAESGHDYYGMAFYSPPASERLDQIESEWKAKLKAQKDDHERYVNNAADAMSDAMRWIGNKCADADFMDGAVAAADARLSQPDPAPVTRELLPCPFCGRRPRLTVRPDNAEATMYFAAVACYCGGYSACAHKMVTAIEANEAESKVREQWNRRPAPCSRVHAQTWAGKPMWRAVQ